MARGKHAAEAARRRYETSLEVVDRLTEKNAELKIRTRRVEAAAARVPALEARIRDLETQLETLVTPHVERMRELHEMRQAELQAGLEVGVGLAMRLIEINGHLPGFLIPADALTTEKRRLMQYPDLPVGGSAGKRELRRARQFARTSEDRNENETERDKATARLLRHRPIPGFTPIAPRTGLTGEASSPARPAFFTTESMTGQTSTDTGGAL
jgi:hypothetical protein